MNNDEISLSPANFFSLEVDCKKAKTPTPASLGSTHLLPDFSDLCNQVPFADVFMGWHPDGLVFKIVSQQPIERSTYPEYSLGDGAELYIDTRDVKTGGFNTRFCHHFCFLAEPVEGFQAAEVTRFRTEDSHDLCKSTHLKLSVEKKKNGYTMNIFIPSQCLVGYDPDQFDRLGFSYKINRWGKTPQHFSAVSSEYQIDQYPSLWSSMRMIA
jgi:hypothetical protein